ncbi:MAG: OsmC family protein [Anaerolineae bacterium]
MAAVIVTLTDGYRAVAKTREHEWYADETIEGGGKNTAPTPPEELLGALGSCMLITMKMYANRKGWPLEKAEVHLELERFNGGDYPAYKGEAAFVHEIREEITLHGAELTEEQRARILEISTKCPVRRVLAYPTFFVEGSKESVKGE